MAVSNQNIMIDETYEYSAPRFFDFINGETDEDMQNAELWFQNGLSYAPSPFMPRIRSGRSVQIEALCDFGEEENLIKEGGGSSDCTIASTVTEDPSEIDNSTRSQSELALAESRKETRPDGSEEESKASQPKEIPVAKNPCQDEVARHAQGTESVSSVTASAVVEMGDPYKMNGATSAVSIIQGAEACTPNQQKILKKEEQRLTRSGTNQTTKQIASVDRNPSALKPRNQTQLSQANGVKPTPMKQSQLSQSIGEKPTPVNPSSQSSQSQSKGVKPTPLRSCTTSKKTTKAPNFTQENQAIKRQKLDAGVSRQILNLRTQNFPHKSRPGYPTNSGFSSATTTRKEDNRKFYTREASVPFVSMAEMVSKFQNSTRDRSLPHGNTILSQEKPKLTLTRPKEPEFETSQRVRSVRVKSTAELEEEMMAKIPKFKARPVNKKILEAPTLTALPRSTPQLPEFQEFHLRTMERATQHDETSTVVSSTESSHQSQWNPHRLTEPKMPRLETLLRARPTKAKSTEELEQEELEKMPKFKARPLNKKIFESKGDLGMYSSTKCQVTVPLEFHFATDERIPPAKAVTDLFDKLSLNSEPCHDLPRLTTPNPFHLHTEERGAEKEKKFMVEVMQKRIEEERARVPKATPYPYTTDYPVVPPKPEPKQCTRPEPFQLESLVRHEEELQREMEERQRIEEEEARLRNFKAQPILKEDPLPVPEKARIPLTQVEEFALHVDHRAVDRAEFDKKVKEKETMYKRYREESESARLMEEEKALKQLRRTLVPHARPAPKFDNPFQPKRSSKETTKPKSPNLRVLRRNGRKTRGGDDLAPCSAASHMR